MTIATSGRIKLMGGRYWVPVELEDEGEHLRLKFGFNRPLLAEIKAMAGARWSPEEKCWRVRNCERNWFQLAFLAGERPYDWYDRPLEDLTFNRPLYEHQKDMARHGYTYRHAIWACEMGTGKSLAAIEVMEASRALESRPEWLYVGPRSAIASFELELRKWGSKVDPEIVTYDGLKRLVENWPRGRRAPFGVIFDECSRIKTPTAQRSVAAYHLAASVRKDWPDRSGFVLLMSGSPAPKGPTDWWHLCEVSCPGFIKEGTIEKFRARLSLTVERESITGGKYPHHVTWWDDERKCATCGQMPDHADHRDDAMVHGGKYHEYRKSKNEVAYLYERMRGLVNVKFKKDVLSELPEKRYRVIHCPPSKDILNAAKLIQAGATTTIQALTLLRELSDGFQYRDEVSGQVDCSGCRGTGMAEQPVPIVDYEELAAAMDALKGKAEAEGNGLIDADGMPIPDHLLLPEKFEMQTLPCPLCGGTGKVDQYRRTVDEVSCPKDQALEDILDAHDEDGRLVVMAGFTGSIDRVIRIVEKMKWQWIKVDGRGWNSSFGATRAVDMLTAFQDKDRRIPRLCFVGHPGSAGMGLTLTESCEIVFFSNDFNGESRLQACDRIHRPGMDVNKGALITDLVHLSSDQLVIDNLTKKQRLQDLSLGAFRAALESVNTGHRV